MRLLAIVPAAAGTTSNINSDHAVALLMAELALKQGNLNEAERHLACIKGEYIVCALHGWHYVLAVPIPQQLMLRQGPLKVQLSKHRLPSYVPAYCNKE